MKELSAADIRKFADDYDRRAGEPSYPLARGYLAACEVVITALGPHWAFEHIFANGGEPSRYLRPKPQLSIDEYKHQDRVLALADAFFNLQHVEGFADRLAKFKSRDLEASVAELEGAKLLFQSEIPFRFVEETGRKGADYDVDATLSTGAVAFETKCKIETTNLSIETIANSIATARDQLPPDKAAVVFMKTPEHWVTDPRVEEIVKGGLQKGFAATRRISAVVLHWDQWWLGEPGGGMRATLFRTEHNLRARHSLKDLGVLVAPKESSRWRYVMHMATAPALPNQVKQPNKR
jgi:hypothetical protein